eukprot:6312595-Pyramimonas_sp.AAC.1
MASGGGGGAGGGAVRVPGCINGRWINGWINGRPRAERSATRGVGPPLELARERLQVYSLSPSAIGARCWYILSPSAIGARYGYIFSPLLQLVPATGMFSLPFCDRCPLR